MKLYEKLLSIVEEIFNVTGEEPVVNVGKNPLVDPFEIEKEEVEESLLPEAEAGEFPQEKKLKSLQAARTKAWGEIKDLAQQIMQHIQDKHAAKADGKHKLASDIEDKQMVIQKQKDAKYVAWMRLKRQINDLRKQKKQFLNTKGS